MCIHVQPTGSDKPLSKQGVEGDELERMERMLKYERLFYTIDIDTRGFIDVPQVHIPMGHSLLAILLSVWPPWKMERAGCIHLYPASQAE